MLNHLPAAVQSYLAEYRYKIELHAHTSPVSGCSHIPPAEIVRRLADKGYHAVAITNHFCYDNQFMKADDPVSVYLADYYAAKDTEPLETDQPSVETEASKEPLTLSDFLPESPVAITAVSAILATVCATGCVLHDRKKEKEN